MVSLSADDQYRLFEMLIPLSALSNERGRESVLISANLQELRPQLDLAGPSAIVVPLMINFLASFGRLSYEHQALGRFLNTMKDYVGLEEREILDNMICKYDLMTPVAKSDASIDWVVPVTSQDMLEKIIGENTLRPIAFLQQALNASRSVAYIEVATTARKWSGTGFMISPNLLLTNQHVLPQQNLLSGAIFRFNYQLDSQGNPELSQDYAAAEQGIYCTDPTLDYVVIEIGGNPGDEWGYLALIPQIPAPDSRVNIIQHPHGLPKQISFQNNFIRFANETKIQYVTTTLPGSSGSPVFDDEWRVIGLHRAGGWLSEATGGPLHFRNEGTAITAILNALPDEVKDQLADSHV